MAASGKFQRDLTEGSVSRQLIRFCLPFLLSNFIQALYSVADMLIVSWYSGPDSVAGVSNGGQVTLVVMNFVIGLAVGGTVLIGQYFGAKRHEDMKRTIGTLLSLMAVMACVLTVLIIALSGPILRLIRVPESSFGHAQNYLNICMGGTVFIFGYNAVSGILRGMGDSKRPLWFVSVACVVNVGLDLLFVGGLHMDAAGAAAATVIAQALSFALAVAYLIRNDFVFDFKWRSFRFDREKLRLIFSVGLPNSLQNVVVSLSFLVMMVLVNGHGVEASAAMGFVHKWNGFAILPAIAMSSSVASMAAQNLGAGHPERARQTMLCGMRIAFPIGAVFWLIAFFFPRNIMQIFTNRPDVIDQGLAYIRFFCLDYLIVPISFSVSGLLIGAGRTTFTMITGMASSIVLRVPLALLFGTALATGLSGIGLAVPVSTLGVLFVSLGYLRTGRWRTSRINRPKI